MSALIRVGHKGADALAPGNTLASFDAALAVGVDMIEFDVLAERTLWGAPHVGRHAGGVAGELFIAHDKRVLDRRQPLTLTQALAHLSSPPFDGVRLQLDIKRAGCEQRVLDALDEAGVRGRAFITTGAWRVLKRMRALAPDLASGWTVPDIPLINGTPLLTPTIGRLYLATLPARAAARIRAGAIDALVPHWSIVTPELVDAVRGAGGELYAWTVDDRAQIARLEALGVTGVITNDPRLFA